MSRRRALGLLLALVAAPLAACGRKGPLKPPPTKDEEAEKPSGS